MITSRKSGRDNPTKKETPEKDRKDWKDLDWLKVGEKKLEESPAY